MSININETGFDVESVLPKGSGAQAQDVDIEVSEQTAERDAAGEEPPAASGKKTKYARTKANQPSALYRDNKLDPELEAQLASIMDSIELPDVGVPLALDAAKPADTMSEIGITSDLLVGSAREEITAKKKGTKKAAGTSAKAPKKPRAKAATTAKKSAVDMETKLAIDEDAMEGASEEEELKAKYILTIQRYQQSPIFGPYLKQMGVKHTADALQKKRNDQLEGIIKQIKTFINNKGAGQGLDYVLFTATGIGEQLVTGVSKGKYNLMGWTADLQGNGTFIEAWEQVKIERLSFAQASPEARMLIGMGLSAANVIAKNKHAATVTLQQMQQQIATNVPADLLSADAKPADPPAESTASTKFELNQSIDRLF